MSKEKPKFSSGLNSLDEILKGVIAGDNVVWQIEDMKDYDAAVQPFCINAHKEGKKLVYFRFAGHHPLLPEDVEAEIYKLNPQAGFEHFISEIFTVIEKHGKAGVCYVFDCLSGLAVDWYSDRMLANFFMLTCPYLYDYDTVTYFVLLRNYHTSLAINAIHNTAQVVIDIFKSNDKIYILPLKVFERYSPTMYMLHSWEENDVFNPVTGSTILSEILSNVPQPWIDCNIDRKDTWTNTFIQAQNIKENLKKIGSISGSVDPLKTQLIKMVLSRDDETLLKLCEKYFDISDLISIGKRMIGTGLIGGKSVGMLLSRAILKSENEKWEKKLETHDSFFIGSDVFYTYLIKNGCWWERRRMKTSSDMFIRAKGIQEKLLKGVFPDTIVEQFKEMLSYFGQSPIIVRSSSLLEDAYGNAFSGKYESVFCANQGTPNERLEKFIEAVRKVYASTMNKEALAYREHRGLLHRDEQMAILVQRVSGAFYGDLYFPQIAGVGYSFNPFVWNTQIDPTKGVLRLVFGLGTRAVDRRDDEYTRIVALNAPLLRPENTFDEVKKYTQRIVDVLDLKTNQHVSYDFEKVARNSSKISLETFASWDEEMEKRSKALKIKNIFAWILTFKPLLTETAFVDDMIEIMDLVSKAYNHPVDIEFSLNFTDKQEYKINLLQCRPFQFKGETKIIDLPKDISNKEIILRTDGPIIGQSISQTIDRIIYVLPSKYGKMTMSDRYSLAKLIGEVTNATDKERSIMLIGPGRWGTTMPALGIPVSFSDIKNVSVLCEIVTMNEGITPDISLGTHFFNDLVDMQIVYMGIFPEKENSIINEDLITKLPNKLTKIVKSGQLWSDSICVIDSEDFNGNNSLFINANTLVQKGIVFLSKRGK